mmetsp:Transcript_24904/g.34761  ORF Transcript_24904/g.34761 Transcript_24904/m.34761 type:complete len:114 (-) Transcript_24904:102-443(-)
MPATESDKKGGNKDFKPYAFLYDVRRIPCMRQTLLNATGTGIALGLHSFYRHRIPATAMFTGMKTAMLVSAVSWITCRINFRNKRRKIYDIMENQEKYSNKFSEKKKSESDSR